MKYLIAAVILMATTCHAGTKVTETDDQIIVEITGTPDPQAQKSSSPVREQPKAADSSAAQDNPPPQKEYSVGNRRKSGRDMDALRAAAEERRKSREQQR